jgi:NAD(P)-dependent dehydrogenase (short-subunit alcohol dehydrogenase family)
MKDQRKVLVTGGAMRLGAALCDTFAKAGWQVLCHYRSGEAQAQALCQRLRDEGHAASAVYADLAQTSDCIAMMDMIGREHGLLDCLVNNASLFIPDTGLDFDAAQAAAQLQVNLLAPSMLAKIMANSIANARANAGANAGASTRAAAPDACAIHILDQKVYNLNPDYFSYTVSKLALERAVSLHAQSLAPHLRVCGVAPGLMYLSGPQTADNFNLAASANLMRRPTDPLDVAKTCLFLASTPSITGTTVSVDNGQHLVPLPRDIMFVVEDLLKKHAA